MPMTCRLCRSEKRAELDAALLSGAPLRDIARRGGVKKDAVARHRPHVAALAVKAEAAAEALSARSLVAEVRALHARTKAILDRVEEKDDRVSLAAVREMRENLTLLLRLAGELKEAAQAQVVISLRWGDEVGAGEPARRLPAVTEVAK